MRVEDPNFVTVRFPSTGQTFQAREIQPFEVQSGDLIDRDHNANIALRIETAESLPEGGWELVVE